MAEAPPTRSTEELEKWYIRSSYQNFVASEDAPLYQGSALEDLNALELADWKRRSGRVGYTRLANQETLSLQIVEIPPGGELKPEHHMYEATMLDTRSITRRRSPAFREAYYQELERNGIELRLPPVSQGAS